MEVAVDHSHSHVDRGFSKSILSLGLLVIIVVLTGCADVITYSRDAQREGMKLYKQGNYVDAAGAFRNSVRQSPQNYEGYYYLGACYSQLGQYQQAIASYKSARLTIDRTVEGRYDTETRQKILNGLASAIARGDQRGIELDAAQQEAEVAQKAESWYVLAKIYAYRGDADSAIDAFNRAALLEPKNFLVAKDYGLYLERLGQSDRAQAPLRRAYTLNQKDEEVQSALRRIGIVPGPSILEEDQLARPIVPKGPIPAVQFPQIGGGGQSQSAAPSSGSTVAAPRD
jgi:tetratricopeptide (TPR) repeat protein